MPKRYHCKECGMPLVCTRKALPNKGMVVDLIAAHECDPTYEDSIEDFEPYPTKFTEEFAGDSEESPSGDLKDLFDIGPGDKRDPQSKRDSTSTAPESTREMIKDADPSDL